MNKENLAKSELAKILGGGAPDLTKESFSNPSEYDSPKGF
jgi:hypothetical protein